jgi:hypothetical protein
MFTSFQAKNESRRPWTVNSLSMSYRSRVSGLNPGVGTAATFNFGFGSPIGRNSPSKSSSIHRFVAVGFYVKFTLKEIGGLSVIFITGLNASYWRSLLASGTMSLVIAFYTDNAN